MTAGPTERAVEKFLAYFKEAKKLHLSVTGKPLEMYKSTDAGCLAEVFDGIWALAVTGPGFVAETLHRLAWGQWLGNGNHRTTLLFLGEFLSSSGIRFPPYGEEPGAEARFERDLNQWIHRSQALIRRRGEPGFAQARLEPARRKMSREGVLELLGPQSEALMMVGPQRLMKAIS